MVATSMVGNAFANDGVNSKNTVLTCPSARPSVFLQLHFLLGLANQYDRIDRLICSRPIRTGFVIEGIVHRSGAVTLGRAGKLSGRVAEVFRRVHSGIELLWRLQLDFLVTFFVSLNCHSFKPK